MYTKLTNNREQVERIMFECYKIEDQIAKNKSSVKDIYSYIEMLNKRINIFEHKFDKVMQDFENEQIEN